jgi:hypothetical protein
MQLAKGTDGLVGRLQGGCHALYEWSLRFVVCGLWFFFGFFVVLVLNVSTGVWESVNASCLSIRFTFRTMGCGRIRLAVATEK